MRKNLMKKDNPIWQSLHDRPVNTSNKKAIHFSVNGFLNIVQYSYTLK